MQPRGNTLAKASCASGRRGGRCFDRADRYIHPCTATGTAILIESQGGSEVLQRRDVPMPQHGPDNIVVKVAFADIHFSDTALAQAATVPTAICLGL